MATRVTSAAFFALTQRTGYHFGVTSQQLSETNDAFHTGSMRHVYSPDVRTATELVTDELAGHAKQDRVAFRVKRIRQARDRAVLQRAAELGQWGRTLPAGVAQGIAYHPEYHSYCAVVVELDNRPETVGRTVERGVTGPRVTKVTLVVDVGLVVNPRGLEAQMQGGISDGIAMALTSSVHLRDGGFAQASWDNYFYTRQWNTPFTITVEIVDSDEERPGGAGELAVAPTCAAVACAYYKATGSMPLEFPINHSDPLPYQPFPASPSMPPSPTNGLDRVR